MVTLSTQEEVNTFKSDYPACVDSSFLRLRIRGEDINSLEPLLGLRYASTIDIAGTDSLKSLSGLDSLKYVQLLSLHSHNLENCSALSQLDSVRHLFFGFSETIQDLAFFQSLIQLGSLAVQDQGDLSSLNGKLGMDMQGVIVSRLSILRNNLQQDLSLLFAEDIDSISRISTDNSTNVTFFKSLPINEINDLHIENSSIVTLAGLDKVEEINSLSLGGFDISAINDLSGLQNVREIGNCNIINVNNLRSIDQILPELNHIRRHLFLRNNVDLEDFGSLDWVEPPQEFTDFFDQRLYIEDNPNLNMCQNYYICRALELYTDSVYIVNNSELCNKDYLIENCDAILSDEVVEASDFAIYPNPLMDQVTITSDVVIDDIMWIDATGRGVNVTTAHSGVYNTADLETGKYLVKIKVGDQRIVKRVVKM